MRAAVVLAVAVLALAPASALGGQGSSPAKPPQSAFSPEVRERAAAIASKLRCPVCQNLSVKDSPSSVAAAFRQRIRELVYEGASDEEIERFFVERYGDWILLSPPREGIAVLVWLAPALVLGGGAIAAAIAIRRWAARGRQLAEAGRARPDELARARARLDEVERKAGVR